MVVHSRMTTCGNLLGTISALVRSKILTLIETVFQYFYSIQLFLYRILIYYCLSLQYLKYSLYSIVPIMFLRLKISIVKIKNFLRRSLHCSMSFQI